MRAGPVVYRREVELPAGVQAVAGRLQAAGYAFVYVDGERVAEFADRPSRKNRPAVKMPWPVDVDLTPWLTSGPHVLAVSAPAMGALPIAKSSLLSEQSPSNHSSSSATLGAGRAAPQVGS